MSKLFPGARNISRFVRDRRANAGVEFAVVVPLMLTMFFGMVEFSSAVSANRKVTLAARTLSDLVSQSAVVGDSDLTNYHNTATAILYPFPTSPDLQMRVTSVYVDPATLIGKSRWSKGWGLTARAAGENVVLPPALQVGDTYLVYAEVKYKYQPAVGYVMKSGISLSDNTYTRPRQSLCTKYPATAVSC